MARKRKKRVGVKSLPRDRDMPLKLYVNDDERERIKANAAAFGMSISAFLRAVGQGRAPASVGDLKAIERLAEISTAQIQVAETLKRRPDAVFLLSKVAAFQAQLSDLASRIGSA